MGKKLHAFLPQNISSAHFTITANICTRSPALTAWESIQAAIVLILFYLRPFRTHPKLQALRRSTQTLIELNSSLHKMWFLS